MSLEVQLIFYNMVMAVIGILLFISGIIDIRQRHISRGMLLILLLACCIVIPLRKDFDVFDVFGGLTIGLCAIGLSIATREQIGKGDGAVIAALGIALGAHKCLLVVFSSSFLMCIVAILVLLFKKGRRQTKLPFLPAIFVGYLLCVIL